MSYSIWLEPALSDAKYLQKIIMKLAQKHDAPIFTPHITLYSKIPRYSYAINAIIECKTHSKINTRIIGIKSSSYLWKTLFLVVSRNVTLVELNNAIKNIVGTTVRYEFNPHISLIYKNLDNRTKRQIIKELKIKSSFKFDKISIIRSADTVSKWKKLTSVRLRTQ